MGSSAGESPVDSRSFEQGHEREEVALGVVCNFEEVLEKKAVPFEEFAVGLLRERLPPCLDFVEEDRERAVLGECLDVVGGGIAVDVFEHIFAPRTPEDGFPDTVRIGLAGGDDSSVGVVREVNRDVPLVGPRLSDPRAIEHVVEYEQAV